MKFRSEKLKHLLLKLNIALLLLAIVSCTSEEENLPDTNTSLNFQIELTSSNLNRQSTADLPDCSENAPAYAEVVLTGAENVGSIANPQRVDFASDSETENLDLAPGNYQLVHFSVYDENNTQIWIAPTDSEFSEFVSNPLPNSVNVTSYEQSSLTVQVVCYENRTLIDPDAITAAEYVSELGVGFDVTWSEFNKYMELYSSQVPQDFADAGFTNVRIRMNEENPDAQFITDLRNQISQSIDNGIYPIIAYQGHYLEETATSDEDAREHLVNWWGNMANQLKDFGPELGFNVLVEISGRYKEDYTAMNSFYEDVYDTIRSTNPTRNIIFPPVSISNPEYLQFLEIPGGDDPYVMAEWHLYAAGPKKSQSKKYWVDGSTAEERENVTGPIETAVQWMNETGHVSWVGAWMAGNYNKENEYSVEEQVDFASFMTRTLEKYNIPHSVNAGNKYYDYETNTWLNRTTDVAGIPVRDAILDPDQAAVYAGADYTGDSARLAVGTYNSSDLSSLGMLNNITSVMVPFDYEVTVYDGDNLTGNSQVLDITTRDLGSYNVRSMEVVYLNSY